MTFTHTRRPRASRLAAAIVTAVIAAIVVAVIAPTLMAQPAPRLDRVLDPPRLPPDARLGTPVDLNHPFPFKPTYHTADEWRTRATALRQQILVALGLWPMPARTPLQPVIHGRIERDGYTVEKVFFASAPGHYVSGNLYRPRDGAASGVRRPAVLTPHGHWENGRFEELSKKKAQEKVKGGGEHMLESARHPMQARAAMLARLGAVVFLFDMVGYADNRSLVHKEGFTDIDAELRLQGQMSLQMWNALRALDFLAGLPDVDPARIGVTGESGGGTQTFLLSAIDDRPAAAFPAVMVGGAMQGGCICENAPLLRIETNNIEVAALFAPKPLGLSAANDWTRDIMTVGLPELKSIYGLFDASDRVTARYFPFEHNFNQVSREVMYDWFNIHLKLGQPTPIVEKPFKPIPPKELSVYDAAHPRPADSADAATLRKTLTRESDAQMAELATRPDEYRRVVDVALHAMVVESTPQSQIAAVPIKGTFRSLAADGFDVHQTLMTRPGGAGGAGNVGGAGAANTASGANGSGEAIPMDGLVPKGWKGGPLVIWAHPDGKASLFERDGRTPIPAIRGLLNGGAAVLAPDVFLTGEYNLDGKKTALPAVKDQDKFAAYRDAYNRTVLAQRVRDLQTTVAFASRTLKPSAIHLVAIDRAGVWALLARALAGNAITRASIDLAHFDFDRVTTVDDEMLLPGALKYGGVHAFAALCTSGETEIYGAPPARPSTPAPATPNVTLRDGNASADAMARWVLAASASSR